MAEYRVNDEGNGSVDVVTTTAAATAKSEKMNEEENADFMKEKKNINKLLSNILSLLEKKKMVFDDGIDNKSIKNIEGNKTTTPIIPSKENYILLDQVRTAYRQSIYGNRQYDASGPTKKAFGFLVKPAKHLVSLQVEDKDMIFQDELTLAERLNCMDFFNTFNLIYTILRFTLFLLISPWLLILVPCIIAGFYTPSSEELNLLFIILWNIVLGMMGMWMVSYIFCYGHIKAMKEILKANPAYSFWLVGSSISYTISSIMFAPTSYNIPAVVTMSFIMTLHKLLFGSTIIFFKQRNTRANYELYFVPKGCFAKLWLFVDTEEIIADVLRHLAVLYSVQASLEAQGKDALDSESLVGLTIAGKAFQITLRQVMNTSYTVSLIFRFSGILQGILKGDLGNRFPNMPHRKVVNIE